MATRTRNMRMQRSRRATAGVALAAAVAAAIAADSSTLHAQQRTQRRRQATIEIRGTVPTPQVVTVRPREVPTYSRQVLVPRFYDHDFWPEIQEGYAIMSARMMTPADSLVLAADSVGTPDVFRLPAIVGLTPLRPEYAYLRKQYGWCATHWWCPTHRVKVRVPADSSALFPPRLPPQPMALGPGEATQIPASQLPSVQQRWCATHWWCPPGGIITTPPSTTPATTPGAPTTPADTTRRPAPAKPDSTRGPPGTSSA
ncbi:MAG TPA: hypothetical protein VH539_00430 [Gemmatimonadaceae bacterium]|jgi:hypothetical protein